MAIYRVVKGKTGREYYVEDHEVPDWAVKPEDVDCIYVVTRTEHPTSLFCQIESIGWIEKSIIEPLNLKRKKDREIVKRIRDAERQGKERSQLWFNMEKAKERDVSAN